MIPEQFHFGGADPPPAPKLLNVAAPATGQGRRPGGEAAGGFQARGQGRPGGRAASAPATRAAPALQRLGPIAQRRRDPGCARGWAQADLCENSLCFPAVCCAPASPEPFAFGVCTRVPLTFLQVLRECLHVRWAPVCEFIHSRGISCLASTFMGWFSVTLPDKNQCNLFRAAA